MINKITIRKKKVQEIDFGVPYISRNITTCYTHLPQKLVDKIKDKKPARINKINKSFSYMHSIQFEEPLMIYAKGAVEEEYKDEGIMRLKMSNVSFNKSEGGEGNAIAYFLTPESRLDLPYYFIGGSDNPWLKGSYYGAINHLPIQTNIYFDRENENFRQYLEYIYNLHKNKKNFLEKTIEVNIGILHTLYSKVNVNKKDQLSYEKDVIRYAKSREFMKGEAKSLGLIETLLVGKKEDSIYLEEDGIPFFFKTGVPYLCGDAFEGLGRKDLESKIVKEFKDKNIPDYRWEDLASKIEIKKAYDHPKYFSIELSKKQVNEKNYNLHLNLSKKYLQDSDLNVAVIYNTFSEVIASQIGLKGNNVLNFDYYSFREFLADKDGFRNRRDISPQIEEALYHFRKIDIILVPESLRVEHPTYVNPIDFRKVVDDPLLGGIRSRSIPYYIIPDEADTQNPDTWRSLFRRCLRKIKPCDVANGL